MAGIKQGLPLSPWLFLFYINDIFDYFKQIYGQNGILETIHLLIHADDTTLLASSRESAEQKFKTMLKYCKENHISLQISKCEFIVINGDDKDREPFVFDNQSIENVPFITLLGSHLSQSGKIEDDLKQHMTKRYLAVHKFYNFIRANKLAPNAVKLKVLQACVTSSLLYNCETFGSRMPKKLESVYFSLIKCCLGVRPNTPNKLVLIESGLPTLESQIRCRQWTFYKRFLDNLVNNSDRKLVLDELRESQCDYLKHYMSLTSMYISKKSIKQHYSNSLTQEIERLATHDNYKYEMYKKFNPGLEPVNLYNTPLRFIRLRLGSHYMPVETGRWKRIPREQRLCPSCSTLGDEYHYIYDCPDINRSPDIPALHELSSYNKLEFLLDNIDSYL